MSHFCKCRNTALLSLHRANSVCYQCGFFAFVLPSHAVIKCSPLPHTYCLRCLLPGLRVRTRTCWKPAALRCCSGAYEHVELLCSPHFTCMPSWKQILQHSTLFCTAMGICAREGVGRGKASGLQYIGGTDIP